MIWIRGVNVFPSAVEAVLREFEELDDEYEIVVDDRHALPELRVRAELKPGLTADAALQTRVARAFMPAIRISVDLELLPFGTLRRAEARPKKRRIVRAQ